MNGILDIEGSVRKHRDHLPSPTSRIYSVFLECVRSTTFLFPVNGSQWDRNHVDPWAKWSGSEPQWVVRNYLLSLELCSQASICPHRPILKFVSGKIPWNTHSHTYLNLDFCSGVISDYEISEQLSINVSLPSQGSQEERLTNNAVLSVATREQDSVNAKFLPFSYYNHHFGHAPHFIYFSLYWTHFYRKRKEYLFLNKSFYHCPNWKTNTAYHK